MGQQRKDNTKRNTDVLRAIYAILASGRIPSLRDVARESGYTNPSTYTSMVNLHSQGLLLRTQIGGGVVYLPPRIAQRIEEGAAFLLEEMESKQE